MQYEQPATLPQPDALSAQQCDRVADHIRRRIAACDGQLSFAQFMHEALYAPGLGYYSAGSTKFGADGDFVTAPEVSPLFGRIVARQCAEVLRGIDGSEVLEFGAGSGKLAIDLLQALEALDALPGSYNILEVSADLQERQRQRFRRELPQLVERIRWVTAMPSGFDGVMVANEVLDALPVERFVRRDSGVLQACVTDKDDGFAWAERPAPKPLAAAVAALEGDLGIRLPNAYTSEFSLAAQAWIAEIAESLGQGAVFLFDYGVSRREYYAPERNDGWLRCHFRHHAHNNPLIHPGIQDLTSWVDFSAVAEAAVAGGLDILGYQTQSQFLLGAGLEAEMQGFAGLSLPEQLELSGQVKTLTLPGEMGENFKCMVLGRGELAAPSAFQFTDRTQTL